MILVRVFTTRPESLASILESTRYNQFQLPNFDFFGKICEIIYNENARLSINLHLNGNKNQLFRECIRGLRLRSANAPSYRS